MFKNKFPTFRPDYEQDKLKIQEFLETYNDSLHINDDFFGKKKYLTFLQNISNRQSKILEVHIEDLEHFFVKRDAILYDNIISNTKRYLGLFYDVVDKIMPKRTIEAKDDELDNIQGILLHQRLANLSMQDKDPNRLQNTLNNLPPELKRHYEIIFVPGNHQKVKDTPMRSIHSKYIGGIVSVKAIVVRVTDVKPFIKVACYSCDICGHEVYQVISGRTFMPLVDCPSPVCKNNQTRGKLYPQTRASKFVSFQEIKIQEPTDQVPIGHVPRSMSVLALGSCTRQCVPGDSVIIHGIYLPTIITGARAFKSRLIHDTYVEAFKIEKKKPSYNNTSISDDTVSIIEKMQKVKSSDIYLNLAKSIAPEIFGHEDLKKSLLLLLVGGLDKECGDGMKIRGNINILLMGDPGVAKSQLLKYISNISPRGVYTTGKGSSGVGLTAAVVKDQITGELTLEGGALVLADMGICCIDEFDKMSDYDRANIHEVMEQQTVSIAKAGITTRLNARTSVLAAANPLYGRYNRKLSPLQNINLPAALLSRFDLIFLLLDKANKENDFELSKHVAFVHQNSRPPKLDFEPIDPRIIRSYIAGAREIKPIIPKDLHNFIIQKYVEKRKDQKDERKEGYQYITPRTLLAIIRLSQGLARLRFNNEVELVDVEEALRLIEVSRSSINEDDEKAKNAFNPHTDPISTIFNIIKDMCSSKHDKTVRLIDIEKKVQQNKKLTPDNLKTCLDDYERLNILYISKDNKEVMLL